MLETITDRASYRRAVNYEGVSILEATADWCANCKAMEPVLEKLSAKFPDAKFYKYDVETAADVAQELGAGQMPTFHIFKDGDIQDSVTGAKAKELEKKIMESYGGNIVEEA